MAKERIDPSQVLACIVCWECAGAGVREGQFKYIGNYGDYFSLHRAHYAFCYQCGKMCKNRYQEPFANFFDHYELTPGKEDLAGFPIRLITAKPTLRPVRMRVVSARPMAAAVAAG